MKKMMKSLVLAVSVLAAGAAFAQTQSLSFSGIFRGQANDFTSNKLYNMVANKKTSYGLTCTLQNIGKQTKPYRFQVQASGANKIVSGTGKTTFDMSGSFTPTYVMHDMVIWLSHAYGSWDGRVKLTCSGTITQ